MIINGIKRLLTRFVAKVEFCTKCAKKWNRLKYLQIVKKEKNENLTYKKWCNEIV